MSNNIERIIIKLKEVAQKENIKLAYLTGIGAAGKVTAGVNFSMKPLTSDYVAKYAIRKMFQKKTVIVPGIVCKFSAVASKLLPSGIIGKVCYEIQKNKSK